jgi:hypothetical protein
MRLVTGSDGLYLAVIKILQLSLVFYFHFAITDGKEATFMNYLANLWQVSALSNGYIF